MSAYRVRCTRMKLKTLPSTMNLKGKRILLRVDWNVPLTGGIRPDESLKIERSVETIKMLTKRGAVVVVLTHLGRPEKPDPHFSTKHLVSLLTHHYHLAVHFHPESVSQKESRAALEKSLQSAGVGSIHLLENVRFEKGEEKNEKRLAEAYASLGDLFINDAFASSHRAHVSVVGIAKCLPSFAGPGLQREGEAVQRLLEKPKKPFLCFIGGLKLSTKIPVLKTLVQLCDRVCIGGAMATPFLAAKGISVGASVMEKESLPLAKKLLAHKNISLPIDVMVTERVTPHPSLRSVFVEDIGSTDMIVDVGPRTLALWGKEIAAAKTILWNGPMGLVEVPACGAGSRFVVRAMARRPRNTVFTVAGGGDTLPVVLETRTQDRLSHVSTGGGALLEFLALKGKLPGLLPFIKK